MFTLKIVTHWTDQCQKFMSMSPSDHLKAVKENHCCFSCLKHAGRDHNASNCSHRPQCSESFQGNQCKYFHHLLIHIADSKSSATALTVSSGTSSQQAILPVVLVEILGSGNIKKQGNLLLDSGAQVSLITLSVIIIIIIIIIIILYLLITHLKISMRLQKYYIHIYIL